MCMHTFVRLDWLFVLISMHVWDLMSIEAFFFKKLEVCPTGWLLCTQTNISHTYMCTIQLSVITHRSGSDFSFLVPFSFFQLVNIGSQYSYSSEDQAEFLVVVSREFDVPAEKEGDNSGKERVSD